MLIHHLGDEQQANWRLQFRDVVSPHRHDQSINETVDHLHSGKYGTAKPPFLYALFYRKCRSFSLVLAQCSYKQCIIISHASFLEVSFSCISHSEFLVPTHYIHGMIVTEIYIVKVNWCFLECTVAVICRTIVSEKMWWNHTMFL
jgi:hypothetical protein